MHNPTKMPAFNKVFPDQRETRESRAPMAPEEAMHNMKLWTAAHRVMARRKAKKESPE